MRRMNDELSEKLLNRMIKRRKILYLRNIYKLYWVDWTPVFPLSPSCGQIFRSYPSSLFKSLIIKIDFC